MIAPASLKQIPLDLQHATAELPLRGMIAPASLKLGGARPDRGIEHSPLRGMIAPASLKRYARGRIAQGWTHHSGA